MAITMEELEKKARAYDEVREKIALRFGSNVAEEIFSEFEMDKDERVRKEIIKAYKTLGEGKIPLVTNYTEIFAWLEKQEEQVEINPSDEKDKRFCSIYGAETFVLTELLD